MLDLYIDLLHLFYERSIRHLGVLETMEFVSRALGVAFVQQHQGERYGPTRPSSIDTDAASVRMYQQRLVFPVAANTTQSLFRAPSVEADAYNFGLHSFWDRVRFLVFSFSHRFVSQSYFIIGSFFVVGLILFPFAEIPIGFANSASHWHRFMAYFGVLFNKLFRFVDGVWDRFVAYTIAVQISVSYARLFSRRSEGSSIHSILSQNLKLFQA